MAALDKGLRAAASSVINALGANIQIVRTVPGTYDPEDGTEATPTQTTYTVKASPPQRYSNADIDGTSILREDLKFYVAALDLAIEPGPEDVVVFRSKTYKIVSVTPQYSGEQCAAWVLQCRL